MTLTTGSESRAIARDNMVKRRKLLASKTDFILAGAVTISVVFLLVFAWRGNQPDSAALRVEGASDSTVTLATSQTNATIASSWQWDNFKAANTKEPGALAQKQSYPAGGAMPAPFDPEAIYNALQAVKLDEKGDVVIDDDALQALNKTLDHDNLNLDDRSLYELQELIKVGLPGAAGEQTAKVVADYYHYLKAEQEFNVLYDMAAHPTKTIDEYEAHYQELSSLRELYMGREVADKLFATADANARYMFDIMQLDADSRLTESEKSDQRAAIVARHIAQTMSIPQWQTRRASFLAEKQAVLDADLPRDEKQRQITALVQQHFSPEELEKINHLSLDALE